MFVFRRVMDPDAGEGKKDEDFVAAILYSPVDLVVLEGAEDD